MSYLPEPKLDTAAFSNRQWFVLHIAFSTKEDAEAAIRLANLHAQNEKQDLADEVRSKINEVLP